MRTNALLDTILIPDADLRVHVYRQDLRPGIDLAEIIPGDGDRLQALFADEGTLVKGVGHESNLSPWSDELGDYDLNKVRPGLLDRLPEEITKYLTIPELRSNETTFSIWRLMDDGFWNIGRADGVENEFDGADYLLSEICITPAEYCQWINEYLEGNASLVGISAVFSGTSSIREIIRSLDRQDEETRIIADLRADGMM